MIYYYYDDYCYVWFFCCRVFYCWGAGEFKKTKECRLTPTKTTTKPTPRHQQHQQHQQQTLNGFKKLSNFLSIFCSSKLLNVLLCVHGRHTSSSFSPSSCCSLSTQEKQKKQPSNKFFFFFVALQ